ncbi:Ricin-type beta-trefoil lectin domain protein [Roseibium album]|nr:Ricin-type beta-trefoil lectin domain protein [Roseibium album]
MFRKFVVWGAASFLTLPAFAEAPDLKTPAPVIYLADNLDEADKLGWCIDTQGRGFGENLHAHSCKPQGGDVQFSFDEETSQIRSVAFDDKCMELIAPGDPKIAFGLRDCIGNSTQQQFEFDRSNGHISPIGQSGSCVGVGGTSRRAGPFLSRDLLLMSCATAAPELIGWNEKR